MVLMKFMYVFETSLTGWEKDILLPVIDLGTDRERSSVGVDYNNSSG